MHAVVTDPPYGLANTSPEQVADTIVRWVNGDRDYLPGGAGFMGKAWDAFVPPVAVWDECLRVLKPGGHVLAFAGSRTHDLMTLALRLAGFDIRDSIAWLYGSGFPKSLDVSKAIDKQRHDWADIRRVTAWIAATRTAAGVTNRDIDAAFGFNGMAGHWTTQGSQAAIPTLDQVPALLAVLGVAPDDVPDEIRALLIDLNGMKGQPGPAWFQREVIQERTMTQGGGTSLQIRMGEAREVRADITAPATPAAARWQGWGTALKPAFEPIVVGRKPLAGTVAANVLAHGTGALNIDATRIDAEPDRRMCGTSEKDGDILGFGARRETRTSSGRWPTNVVLDDTQGETLNRYAINEDNVGGFNDSGGASRFFPTFRYEAKAPTSERPRVDGVAHPTVKPLDLMRWLVRLVTPPGGTVLEPFAGSGTTVEACIVERFHCIAIEREADYLPLIMQRVNRRRDPVAYIKAAGDDLGLFDLEGLA
jgi:DNA modification methylase